MTDPRALLFVAAVLCTHTALSDERGDPPVGPELPAEILSIEGDRDYGQYLASDCLTCHRTDGENQGIPSITGWPNETFVTVMHSYKARIRANPVMQMMAGRLSNEEIASLAVYFGELE